jgi:hypothetical protein
MEYQGAHPVTGPRHVFLEHPDAESRVYPLLVLQDSDGLYLRDDLRSLTL